MEQKDKREVFADKFPRIILNLSELPHGYERDVIMPIPFHVSIRSKAKPEEPIHQPIEEVEARAQERLALKRSKAEEDIAGQPLSKKPFFDAINATIDIDDSPSDKPETLQESHGPPLFTVRPRETIRPESWPTDATASASGSRPDTLPQFEQSQGEPLPDTQPPPTFEDENYSEDIGPSTEPAVWY